MAIERIESQDNAKTAAASPATVTYAATPTAGNLLVAAVRGDKSAEPAVFDSKASWTKAAGSAKGSSLWGGIFYKIAVAEQPKEITMEVSGATNCYIDIYEFKGTAAASVLDAAKATESAAPGTSTTGAEITTAKAGELVFSTVAMGASTSSPSVDSEFTLLKTSVRNADANAIKNAGEQKPQFSWTTSQNWVHTTAAFFAKEEGTPPEVTTKAASGIATTLATLNGEVDPNGKATTYGFEYGTSEALGTKVGEGSAGEGSSPVAKSYELNGLSPGIKYYFRVKAENADGTATGSILNFTAAKPEKPLPFFGGAGQSNFVGQGNSAESPVPTAGTAFEYNNAVKRLVALKDPFDVADTGSAWPSFAIEWNKQTGKQVALLGAGKGGTPQVKKAKPVSASWEAKEEELFTDFVEELKAAIADLESEGIEVDFKGILWCQGETDGAAIEAELIVKAEYKAAFEAMIAGYRAEFGATMPFFIFRIGARRSSDPVGWKEIRAAQDEVAAADPYTFMVFTNSVNFPAEGKMLPEPEQDHYNQAGYNEMGTVGAQGVAAAEEPEPGEGPVNFYPLSNRNKIVNP